MCIQPPLYYQTQELKAPSFNRAEESTEPNNKFSAQEGLQGRRLESMRGGIEPKKGRQHF